MVTFECDTLTVRPWADDVIDSLGFDPRAPYVERFWLGVLGPSTTWLLRRIAAGFDQHPEGFEMSLGETAQALGLGDRGGRHSPFLRTVNRMIQFELARVRHRRGRRAGGPAAPAAAQPAPDARLSPALKPPTSAGRPSSSRSRRPKPSAGGAASWPSACSSWARTSRRRSASCCGGATTRRRAERPLSWAAEAHRSAAAAEAG